MISVHNPWGNYMLKTISLALLTTALSTAAFAADNLPTKAPALNGYPTVHCGAYYGVNTGGSTAFMSNAVVGTQVAQGSIGLTVGFTCPLSSDGSTFAFVDGDFNVANLNGSSNGFAFSGPLTFEQRFGFGTPISTMLSVIPGFNSLPAQPSLIPLPAGVNVVTSSPYIFASLHEDDIGQFNGLASNKEYLISVGIGVGTKVRLNNNVVFDPYVEAYLPSSRACLGPLTGTACTQATNQYKAGFKLEY
jgi:hypothetical protein